VAAPLISRGDIHFVALDPSRGGGLRKTRPCVVVSPDELNHHLRTVIVAPMTSASRAYPWRVPCRFRRRAGVIALDQLRTVDRDRLSARKGALHADELRRALAVLQEMFSD
jgi:mRNA interferase MazF